MKKTAAVIESSINRIVFGKEGGGFPTLVAIRERNGRELKIMENRKPQLTIELADGRVATPYLPDDFKVSRSKFEEADRIEFRRIPFRDKSGNPLDNFFISLRYEFWSDGTVFVNSFFLFESPEAPPAVCSFRLEFPVLTEEFDRVHSAYIRRQGTVDPNVMDGTLTKRFMGDRKNCHFNNELLTNANFACHGRESAYIEFLMEGHVALSGKRDGVCSGISWKAGNPTVYWDFQCEEHRMVDRPWQWRNQWAWIIAPPPRTRHLPPLRMYHYFDNFIISPTDRQIRKMAENGADLLIMHENWRLDMQNGGIPRNADEFERVVKKAHSLGMRVAPYIRGSEKSATEESCDWFDNIFRKDWDGLYMDYGGAQNESSSATETFPGGCCHFRRHFLKLKSLRKRVGRDGVFFSHTGPVFSPIGMTGGNVDAYVSGEGERGVMIRGRTEHEYFSSAFAVNGSMWTAAFPEYGTSRMVPFMAATGQFPHVNLGTQFASSSLSHPNEPGINIAPFRPLWKLWGLFKKQRDIAIFNDYNSYGTLTHGDNDTAGYLMISKDRKSSLLITSNFNARGRMLKTTVDWKLTGFNPEKAKCFKLSPDVETPGEPEEYQGRNKFTATVKGYGVTGWLLTHNAKSAQPLLKEYARPYPEHDASDKAYFNEVETQRRLREEPDASESLYLQIATPTLINSYEDSMWWELYKNAVQIGTFDANGKFKPVGWIGKNGFSKTEPKSENYVWPGHISDWVDLGKLLPKGKHHIGLKSIQNGDPFYSFITATLSPRKDASDKNAYLIRFFNELEPDRAYLRFKIELTT